MGTILASAIFEKVETILQDTTGVRWPEPELIGWINSAERQIVMLKPDTLTETTPIQLVAGTKQTIPANALLLLDVIRNMGPDGETPGRAITPMARTVLDNALPNWHDPTGVVHADVKHYCYDVKNPKTFFVYPVRLSVPLSFVECAFSVAPTEITQSSSPINLDDVYEEAIVNFILYKAYSKDSEYAGNSNRASSAHDAFLGTLGMKTKADVAMAPIMTFGTPSEAQNEVPS